MASARSGPTGQKTKGSRPPGRLVWFREGRTPPAMDELDEEERDRIYEAAKNADHEIPALQAMPIRELQRLARSEGVEAPGGLGKQELIFHILRARVTSAGLGWGEGVLDVLPDGFGFLRSRQYSYVAGPDDIYVSPSQIRRLGLRPGHRVAGPVRPPKEGEKYFALLHVEAVNDRPVPELRERIPFDELTPILPTERLRLEHPGCAPEVRMLDFLAPIGKGQRVLVRTPPLSGRTALLTHLAEALLTRHPEVYVILLAVDAHPEEVTEMERRTGPDERREVAASTFDEPPARHVGLAEIVLEKARRMVEYGHDVVLLMDSLTQLTRAYNTEVPHSGKILSAGLDATALYKPKRLLGSARKLEEGGSLTVIATVLTDTGSRINDVILDEFTGKANCEIVLDAALADLHVAPALDIAHTRTRREDELLDPQEHLAVRALRRRLADYSARDAVEQLLEWMVENPSNDELLGRLLGE